jgi:hypothetical protein
LQSIFNLRFGYLEEIMRLRTLLAFLAVTIASCAPLMGVREGDLEAWVGVPASELDRHPFFITVPLVKTVTPDGTEIRNYVNGRNFASCTNTGAVFGGTISFANYNSFTSCMANFAACNNIFYIKQGKVEAYVPVGTGGLRCYTDARLRPGFRAATNF